jgi:hypothetical protein
VFGQIEYSPLVIFNNTASSSDSIGAYINSLYLISISIAALLAVIKLIIAGAKYMLSDIVTTQSEAKKEIRTSLLGLLLVISAVLILNVINPALISNQLTIDRVNEASGSAFDERLNADGTKKVGVSEFRVQDYGDIDLKYVTRYGNERLYDFKAKCTDDPGTSWFNVGLNPIPGLSPVRLESPRPQTFAECEAEEKDNFQDFCISNAGQSNRARSKYATTHFTCLLPTKSITSTAAEKIWQETKLASDTTFDIDAFERLCQEQLGGNFRDIDTIIYTGVDDYRCVFY